MKHTNMHAHTQWYFYMCVYLGVFLYKGGYPGCLYGGVPLRKGEGHCKQVPSGLRIEPCFMNLKIVCLSLSLLMRNKDAFLML